ncbi:CHAT domain-containing protein [Spongiactinospora sp. TRM90649]|uniref:CHAT domain-containing protein n=1 Tax=Spongiactinospora sp. TRM90649 TaxID=3031114 RepID=UPI0023F9C6C4|nr:CHAT domain-containing protein [Spongiactinospora sp. TRM90649]MDF5758339.1 CHAT domain-containing protein [Spongiactinospora sp. TRM90649]
MESGVLSDRARAALRMAEVDPPRSVTVASGVAADARAAGDLVSAAVAERALGLAALHLQDLDTALRHLRVAVRTGYRARAPQIAAEARMTLAFVLNVRGRPRHGLREIDAALAELRGVPWARATAQRGAILNQLGRLDEALSSYRTALPHLRRAKDHLWVQRVLLNRAVLHGRRQEFGAAQSDLRAAEELCLRHDLGLPLAFVRQNLGWIRAMRGDVPAALRCFEAAEATLRDLRSEVAWLLLDRGELLLSVHLIAEAREAAEAAVRAFQEERRGIGLPEARLLLARARALDGDAAGAHEQAGTALREFTRQQRPEWAALARYVALRSRLDENRDVRRDRADGRRLEQAADELCRAGWPAEALEARLAAADLALRHGRVQRACEQLSLVSVARRRGPVNLRAMGWHAEALIRRSRPGGRGALAAAGHAMRILIEHQSTWGATDLRAHAAAHRVDLAELGLRLAMERGRPAQVLSWAEQGRATSLLARPVRPPSDPRLAAMLARLRVTVAEIEESAGERSAPARLLHRQVALEREIRDYCRAHPPGRDVLMIPQVGVEELAKAQGPAALLEFVHLDGTLHVLTLVEGRLRLTTLGPSAPLPNLLAHIPFTLRRLARPETPAPSREAGLAMLRDIAARIDDFLFGPVRAEIRDRPLVLAPTGALQFLPWAVLPSCAGRPVTVAPSLALWHAGLVSPRSPGHVLAAAGPGLPEALREARSVAALHDTAPLVGAEATAEAVTSALNGSALAHLAAHGRVHPTNPLFSAIRLHDGPLTAFDLQGLASAPQIVVLAACDAGRSAVRPGDEVLGLGATLLAQGTRQVVAPVIAIQDALTGPLMTAFHRLLIQGLSAATALACAQRSMSDHVAAWATAVAFLAIGADQTFAPASSSG